MSLRNSYVDTPRAAVHRSVRRQPPVLFPHQTPRSWDEYAEVVPIADRSMQAIAMDTLRFGQSSRVDVPTLAPWLGCRSVIEGAGVAQPEQGPDAFAPDVLAVVTAPDG